jgi:hypothetical protein
VRPRFHPARYCSIGTVTSQGRTGGAACGVRSADRHPLAGDDPPAPLASGIDRAIRLFTAAAVLAVAGIAAYVSYGHAYAVIRAHGETGITARLEPAMIDGLVYASSMVVCTQPGTGCRYLPWPAGCSRRESPLPSRPTWHRAGLTSCRGGGRGLADGQSRGLVRTFRYGTSAPAGAADRGPSAEHLGNGGHCCAEARPVPASAAYGERPEGACAARQTRRGGPRGRAAGQSPISASGQRVDEALETGAGNGAAVAAYRLSVQAATRCPSAGSPRCSNAHPPLGASQDRRCPASTIPC